MHQIQNQTNNTIIGPSPNNNNKTKPPSTPNNISTENNSTTMAIESKIYNKIIS